MDDLQDRIDELENTIYTLQRQLTEAYALIARLIEDGNERLEAKLDALTSDTKTVHGQLTDTQNTLETLTPAVMEVLEYLRENPEDAKLSVRKLADKVPYGKSVVGDALKAYKDDLQ